MWSIFKRQKQHRDNLRFKNKVKYDLCDCYLEDM